MRPSNPLRHEALAYAGAGEFGPSCAAAAQAALDAGRRVLVLATEDRLESVRVDLGDLAEQATLVPTDEHGRNPSRITALLDGFSRAPQEQRSLALTDWGVPGRSRAASAETQLAESLLNLVSFDAWPLDVLCLYDTSRLDGAGLADMRRVHPSVRGHEANPEYQPDLFDALFAGSLLAAPMEIDVDPVGPAQLAETRALVRLYAEGCALAPERVQDLVVAANEIVTNSIRHGGGSARVALWEQEDAVVCQVADAGRITDPLAGRLAPPASAGSGRGLWRANQLCDLVQIRSSAAGTVVRLFVERS